MWVFVLCQGGGCHTLDFILGCQFDAKAFAHSRGLQANPIAAAHVVVETSALYALATVRWVQPRYPVLAWEASAPITHFSLKLGAVGLVQAWPSVQAVAWHTRPLTACSAPSTPSLRRPSKLRSRSPRPPRYVAATVLLVESGMLTQYDSLHPGQHGWYFG